ncbi:MAG: phosphate acyltransferase PlsX [Thermomicrobiales bacterium]
MRIAVDAMGGDVGPAVVVPAAIEAARTFGVAVSLVGRTADLTPLLRLAPSTLDVQIVEAPETIEMDDHPVTAVRKKPLSSINVALGEVKSGRADAMISAGNSGAVMTASLLVLGRIPGIERPALASVLPNARGRTILLDLGAVTDPKPQHLVQFAHMATVYGERVLRKSRPTVALLSNGEEPSKGNALVLEVHELLQADKRINFVGNVEGKEILKGNVDIIVTDGFTGSVALKTMEGLFTVMSDLIREELTATLPRKMAAAVLRPAFRNVRTRLDYAEIGGAPLLGVNGPVIIAHGRSNERAMLNAMGAGIETAKAEIVAAIRDRIRSDSNVTVPAPAVG